MFYENFQKLCDSVGKTPYAVVTEIGLSNSISSSWKKKGYTPRHKTIAMLADYFGVSIDELTKSDSVDGAEDAQETGQTPTIAERLSGPEADLINRIRQLNSEDQESTLSLCLALVMERERQRHIAQNTSAVGKSAPVPVA